jgi:cyclic beta-1,2-glucan synthetase
VPGHVPIVDLSAEDAGTEPLVTPSDDAWDERAVPLDGPIPGVQLLSNGTYSVFVTGAGGGLSRYRGTALTRWREDAALDSGGVHLYVRDAAMGRAWSTTFRPTLLPADECTATFSLDVGRFHRVDGGIETLTEVVVSPELPGEIRRLTLVNHGDRARTLDVTSFAEVALNDQAADLAHPAFGNLFVESRLDQQTGALLLGRRPRGPHEPRVWLAHAAVAIHGRWQPGGQHETSRARFLGRGRDASRPAAIEPGANLSGTTGSVLDPCVALRRRVTLGPGQRAAIAFVLAAGESSEEVLATAARLASPPGVARTFELAWTDARVELRHLGLVARQAHRFQDLAASLLFNDPDRRASSAVVAGNTRTQSALWAYGISGDNPIVLVRVDDDSTELVAEMLLAHEYWRANGLMADLVILSEHPGGYLQPVHDSLLRLVQGSVQAMSLDRPGGVFVRRGDQVAAEDSVLLDAVARVVLRTSKGRLARQLRRVGRPVGTPPSSALTAPRGAGQQPPALERLFWNGLGGFTPDGREYVIDLPPGANTPAPWVNVIANPSFGFVVTEAGTGFTWQGNSQSNRLTPWSNDPVADPSGEALYLRDEDSGRVWSPTPRPAPGDAWYRIRHGQGYSVFEHTSEEVAATCTVVAARDEPVKVWRVRLRNTSTRPRRLSATAYVEWVLGTTRERAAAYVVTQWDAEAGAVLARNRYADAAGRIAFLATSAAQVGFTGDRTDFLGRNGSHAVPAALRRRQTLTGHVGGGFDPCGAVQARLDLAPGEEREVVFLLGETDSPSSVRHLVATYGDPERAERAAEASRDGWEAILGTLEVHTPEPALDLLVNRWLLYQTLSCRLWGRSAFYQSGGAYGFRDQLQDALALLMAAPELAREQILRAAARQFAEGDVQHWWHPETGQGVRTHYSDDLLWLPYVTAAYVAATGDRAVLDVEVPFLELRELELEEHDLFAVPAVGASASLYEHCLRAVARGRTKGPHGLPLIGGGDWNDGMNRVGAAGRGESIWLAWFLARVELDVAVLCEERGDSGRARELRDDAQRLGRLVDEQAWDGGWYYRAYDDDGRPIGSHRNDECRIDAIAQSWAVLSGVGDPARARTALGAAETHLARGDDRLLLLLTPPFDRSDRDPGYIKGYPPGVRENGGQYTHGAIWGVWARAELRDGARAHELFGWLNPINHARTPEEVDRYKVEPYVVAADVYANPQHVGRGGWTWYTGSASWLYRLAVEALLGLRLHGGRLTVDPVLPSSWPGFTARLRRGGATYDIEIKNGPRDDGGAPTVELDGQPCPDGTVSLCEDGRSHRVVVVLGEPRAG